jgi:hypothetical protein
MTDLENQKDQLADLDLADHPVAPEVSQLCLEALAPLAGVVAAGDPLLD